jgi:hypothetical protein
MPSDSLHPPADNDHHSLGRSSSGSKRFVVRYLDPASRLGEILFGLIMVLTITLTAGLTAADGKEGVRQLLWAAVGCNIAWGIIDAVMYIMNCITVRNTKVQLIEAVQSAPDTSTALNLIEENIEPELQEFLPAEEVEGMSQSMLNHIRKAKVTTPKLTRDEIYGAIACFWLVFISCLPAALPFLFFSQPHLALRLSNFLLIALLFLVGRKWAQFAGTNQLLTGGAMVAIGLALVGLAILLGG